MTTQKMQGNKDSWIEILQKADTIDDISFLYDSNEPDKETGD